MTGMLVLSIWSITGVLASVALSGTERSRWAWTPLAAVLGPLWISVAVDQRAVARRARQVPLQGEADELTIWLTDPEPIATPVTRFGGARQ